MSVVCDCGHQMHRHGSRSILVADHQVQGYCDLLAHVQRFRCPKCLSTAGVETPQIEPGFKLTKTAAAKLVEMALSSDIQACSHASGVDKSTISRLLSAKADAILHQQTDLRVCRLKLLRPSILAMLDQRNSTVIGFLPGISKRLLDILLERLGVETVIPCAHTAPHAFSWLTRMTVTLTGADFAAMLKGLFNRAATKMIAYMKLPDQTSPTAAAQLLNANLTTLSTEESMRLSKLAPAGTPARGFIRMKDRLLSVHDAPDLTTARSRLAEWKEDCRDLWSAVFSGVLQFLEAYKNMILSNAYALQPAAIYPGPPPLRPANVMTLQLQHAKIDHEHRLILQR